VFVLVSRLTAVAAVVASLVIVVVVAAVVVVVGVCMRCSPWSRGGLMVWALWSRGWW
jgi:hypothetical protein